MAADSDGDLLGDRLEVGLGTNPTNQLTPAWLTSTFLGFAVGIGLSVTSIRSGRIIVLVDRIRAFQYSLVRSAETAVDVTDEATESQLVDGTDEGGDGADIAESAEAVVERRADSDLLADEELVTEMLLAEAGRMKQSEIVETTDWSKAKVSRLLSRMADEDDVVKLRLGRENLICLEEARPATVPPDRDAGDRSAPLDPSGSGGVC